MATLRENFAANLKRLLQERKMTQRSLAEKLGMTEAMVSKWTNKAGFPEERQIERVAKILGVPFAALFSDAGVDVTTTLPSRDLDEILKFLAKNRGYKLIKDN